ncbi:MAG: TlpA family protein disulfide reductase [Akkermansiaceae bacterium]
MKSLSIPIITSIILTTASISSARTWTSSDGGKTFDGDYVKQDSTSVTVKRGYKTLTFKIDILSEADQQWLQETATAEETAAAQKAATEKANALGSLGETIAPELKILSGTRFKKHELESTPQYYFIYFGASWCPPCRAAAPDLVKSYNTKISTNDKVELVWCTRDDDESAAAGWAKSESFPWPTIMKDDTKKANLAQFIPRGIPAYILVDKEGNQLATGKSACMEKISELTK